MASGMRIWFALCLGGLGIAAVLLLPPRTARELAFRSDGGLELQPAGEELVRLEKETREITSHLAYLRLQDRVDAEVADALAAGRTSFLVFTDGTAASDEADAFRQAFDAQVGSDDPPRALVGVLFVDPTAASAEGLPPVRMGGTYAGHADDGTPYCVRVENLYRADDSRSIRWALESGPYGRSRDALGLCRYWQRFGAPGEHIAPWFEAGGFGFALGYSWWQEYYEEALTRTLPFGIDGIAVREPEIRGMRTSVKACLHESLDACERMVLDTAAFHHAGDSPTVPGTYHAVRAHTDLVGRGEALSPLSPASYVLFSTLEETYGPAALERFWTSGLPVAEAFEEATGSAVGPWIRDWLRASGMDRPTGSAFRPATAGLSLLTILVAAGLALLVHRRREVA